MCLQPEAQQGDLVGFPGLMCALAVSSAAVPGLPRQLNRNRFPAELATSDTTTVHATDGTTRAAPKTYLNVTVTGGAVSSERIL
jgi:hypothetical protein